MSRSEVRALSRFGHWRTARPLWGSLLLAHLAWTAHLVIGYFTVEALCTPVAASGNPSIRSEVWLPMLVITGIVLLVAIGATVWLWRHRRHLPEQGAGLARSHELVAVVMGMNVLFALLIVAETVPLVLVGCGG